MEKLLSQEVRKLLYYFFSLPHSSQQENKNRHTDNQTNKQEKDINTENKTTDRDKNTCRLTDRGQTDSGQTIKHDKRQPDGRTARQTDRLTRGVKSARLCLSDAEPSVPNQTPFVTRFNHVMKAPSPPLPPCWGRGGRNWGEERRDGETRGDVRERGYGGEGYVGK